MDIWYGFACKMLDLLKPKGIECFIAQNNWTTSAGASIFRNKVISENEIKLFTDFGNFKVFETAGIQTMVYILKKTAPRDFYELKYSLLANDKIRTTELVKFLNFSFEDKNSEKYFFCFKPSYFVGKPFTFNNDIASNLLEKIKNKGNMFLTEKEVAQGIVPNPDIVNSRNIKILKDVEVKVGDGVFVVPIGFFKGLNTSENKYIKKIFEPKEVSKYQFVTEFEKEIIYITKSNYGDDAPTLIEHLKKFKKIMMERRENKNGRLEFFHLHWPRDEKFFEKGDKILSVRKCSKPTFIYTSEPAYVMMSFNIIKTNRFNMKYLTALLNSKIIEYWLKNMGKMQGNNFQIDKDPLLAVPLLKTSSKTSKIFENLVDSIIQNNLTKLKTSNLEHEIDNLVYKLYGLTYEEALIIEPEFSERINIEKYNSLMIDN